MDNLLKFCRYEPNEDPIRANKNATYEERLQDPIHMAPHVWHVSGHEDLGDYLIDTGDGLVLIDTPTPDFQPALFDAIKKSGHDVKDIKWHFISHWHGDHDGCSAAVKAASGCKIIMAAEDWGCKCNVPKKFPIDIPFYMPDEIIWDATAEYKLGNITFHIRKAPGHTPGVLVFYFDDVDEDGNVYHVAMHGGMGCAPTKTLMENFIPASAQTQFINDCLEMAKWDVDIVLPSHLNQNGLRKAFPEDLDNWRWFVDKRAWTYMLLERRGYIMELRGREAGMKEARA